MKLRQLVGVAVLATSQSLGVQGGAGAALAPQRVSAPAIGMNAPVVKVAVRNNGLAIGTRTNVLYTWNRGDPPCDDLGTTVYAGHAWRAGNGVADKWGSFQKGNRIRVAGCTFKVTKVVYWRPSRSIKPLFRLDGPARVVLIGCKADDYSKRVMVFARKVNTK